MDASVSSSPPWNCSQSAVVGRVERQVEFPSRGRYAHADTPTLCRGRCKVRFSRWCGFSNFAWSVTSRSQTLDPGRGLNRPFPMVEWKTFYILRGGGQEEVRWRPPPLPSNLPPPPSSPSLICDARESKLGLGVSMISIDRTGWLGSSWRKRRIEERIDELGWTNEWMESNELNCWKVWFKSNCNLGNRGLNYCNGIRRIGKTKLKFMVLLFDL